MTKKRREKREKEKKAGVKGRMEKWWREKGQNEEERERQQWREISVVSQIIHSASWSKSDTDDITDIISLLVQCEK